MYHRIERMITGLIRNRKQEPSNAVNRRNSVLPRLTPEQRPSVKPALTFEDWEIGSQGRLTRSLAEEYKIGGMERITTREIDLSKLDVGTLLYFDDGRKYVWTARIEPGNRVSVSLGGAGYYTGPMELLATKPGTCIVQSDCQIRFPYFKNISDENGGLILAPMKGRTPGETEWCNAFRDIYIRRPAPSEPGMNNGAYLLGRGYPKVRTLPIREMGQMIMGRKTLVQFRVEGERVKVFVSASDVKFGPVREYAFDLGKDITIGREADNAIIIDSDRAVSENHCRFSVVRNGTGYNLSVEDHSVNGTLVEPDI